MTGQNLEVSGVRCSDTGRDRYVSCFSKHKLRSLRWHLSLVHSKTHLTPRVSGYPKIKVCGYCSQVLLYWSNSAELEANVGAVLLT